MCWIGNGVVGNGRSLIDPLLFRLREEVIELFGVEAGRLRL